MTTTAHSPDTRGSGFAPLLREIKAAGLLERRTAAYAISIGVNVALTALTWIAIAAVGSSWWVLLLAIPLGILTTRAAFFGHDAGHQQITNSRRLHDWIGMLHGNFVLGMSYAWWNDKHNRHHANPNHTDKDPDVGEGILVWTRQQAEGRKGLEGWLSRNQARIFFPLLTLEGFNLKVSSIRFLLQRRRTEQVEIGLMVAHLVCYFTALFVLLSPAQALVFALLHHMIFGLHLGSVFAPGHKGMEMPGEDSDWGHLEKQVLTSRNINGGLATDWMMGGLNYQIEHHLFPSMPRANLRFAQPIVQQYCEKVGLPYLSTGLIHSYRMGLRHMHEVGRELREEKAFAR
ncbi:fatty acid desaturase family protein [Kribbella sp. NPDC051587]|uniref:fatty acid desaturase family protein n=1 Tax=Kribbella sp. NPDC051587 TaxID=3364119 RepID=UPI0037BAE628